VGVGVCARTTSCCDASPWRFGLCFPAQAQPTTSLPTSSCLPRLHYHQVKTPERGFSTAKFLPGSRDTVLVAVKSAEDAAKGQQTAFITIYGENPDGSWRTLLEETEIPGNAKYEGLEVLSWGK
jgi:hypothetical protein